jgi:hypothetical protein
MRFFFLVIIYCCFVEFSFAGDTFGFEKLTPDSSAHLNPSASDNTNSKHFSKRFFIGAQGGVVWQVPKKGGNFMTTYSYGFKLGYAINKSFSLSAGINFEQFDFNTSEASFDEEDRYWFNGTFPDKTIAEQKTLNFPLVLNYSIPISKIDLVISAGIEGHFIQRESLEFIYNNASSDVFKNIAIKNSEFVPAGSVILGFGPSGKFNNYLGYFVRVYTSIPISKVGFANTHLHKALGGAGLFYFFGTNPIKREQRLP